MDQKMVYAFRGWIAFIAFMDLGTAVRSYIEKRSFLSKTMDDINEYVDEEYTSSRILGMYSILKAVALIHCTLFIHYKPVLSLGLCSLMLTVILYFTETIYFRAANLNFYYLSCVIRFCIVVWYCTSMGKNAIVLYTCSFLSFRILGVITLGGLLFFLKHLKIWDNVKDEEEQPTFSLGGFKRKRNLKRSKPN